MIYHLATSLLLFIFGIRGVFPSRRNIILTIMSLEIMLLAVNFNFLSYPSYLDDFVGNLFVLFVLTVGASETAIGLSLVLTYHSFINSK